MKFSQRIGKSKLRDKIQIESIDKDLNNGLWNTILIDFFASIKEYSPNYNANKRAVINLLWINFFKNRIDEIPKIFASREVSVEGVIDYIKNWYFNATWYQKYDLLEFIVQIDVELVGIDFSEACNATLKKEQAGYRFINFSIVQITDKEEIIEIENALINNEKWDTVSAHLNTALNFLSERKEPNYRNSIKESISAVEAAAIIITENPKATLGDTLKKLEQEKSIHGALKAAFSKLYGYTSDSGGIRHALIEGDSSVEFEEARFMLVTCSAFINYLKIKSL